MSEITLSASDPTPFRGYRTARFDSPHTFEKGPPELIASIEHFFQAERFRGVDERLRKTILEAGTAKEAHKLGNRHEASERPGWHAIQERVMATGIWMKLRDRPEFAKALLEDPELCADAYPFRDVYWGAHRKGVSQDRYRSLLEGMRAKLISRSMVRVAVTGSASFSNLFFMFSKLNLLFRQTTPDVILIGCRKGADDLAERWAIDQCLPVKHVPYRGRRSSTEQDRHRRALLSKATHFVAFCDEEDKETLLMRDLAALYGCHTRVLSTAPKPKNPAARLAVRSGNVRPGQDVRRP